MKTNIRIEFKLRNNFVEKTLTLTQKNQQIHIRETFRAYLERREILSIRKVSLLEPR